MDFTSISDVAFSAMEWAVALYKKASFIMDRGYDDNKMFLKLDSMGPDYVIRLTSNANYSTTKWLPATKLRNRRNDRANLPLFYKGRIHEAYLSHVKVTDHCF